jgi:DNA-directed RNA polymerase specialized sigma subunit
MHATQVGKTMIKNIKMWFEQHSRDEGKRNRQARESKQAGKEAKQAWKIACKTGMPKQHAFKGMQKQNAKQACKKGTQ